MKLSGRMPLLCAGAFAFALALVVEVLVEERSQGHRGSMRSLLREHALGVGAGMVCGALPFLLLLSRRFTREKRHRVNQAEASGLQGARLADMEELQDANRLVTVARLASMAHELGTPLGVVQARAQMIAESDLPDAEQRQDVEVILQQTRRMTRMVQEVLELARPRLGVDGAVDLVALARQATALLSPAAGKHGVTVKLVESGSAALARGDASKLLQILTNLTNNAQESMPAGGTVTLTVGARLATPPVHSEHTGAHPGDHPSTWLFVDVRDEGSGIERKYLPRIFDTFFTTKRQGSGLGLSVSYRIAGEHGGWIEVDSAPDKGSCFTLFLPTSEVPA